MRVGVMACALAIGGCSTYAEIEQARFASFSGMTMARFMRETLITPRDYFEQDGRRIFVVEHGTCRMQVAATANGKVGADAWTIVEIRRTGGCHGV